MAFPYDPYNVYGGYQEIVGNQPQPGQPYYPPRPALPAPTGVGYYPPPAGPPAHMGAGLDEIIGAILDPRSGGQVNPALRNALMQRVAAAQPVVQNVPPTSWRKWTTGVGPVRMAAGATGTVTIAPQLLFKVKKMVLTDINDSGVGAGYASSVTRIDVGQQNQLPNNTTIPTWAFGITAQENEVDWDTCQGAYSMTLVFSATYACTVTGALYGLAVKSS